MTMFIIISVIRSVSFAEDLALQPLIDEAVEHNHEILMAESKWKTSSFRIPQAKSLSDPMFMFGYQNEGYDRYTYGEMQGAQWMFSASQMFPFPGKLSLKGSMAEKDAEVLEAEYELSKQRIIAQVKERYYDLFLTYKNLDLINEKKTLLEKIEDAAAARYSSGMSPQQEILMAQIEKYMLLEREKMFKQKIESIDAMLNSDIGRDVNAPLGKPSQPDRSSLNFTLNEFIKIAVELSPEIRTRQKMIETAQYKIKMAEKEYYPDFTLTGSVFKRAKPFEDMWSLNVSFNIPIFYRSKQRNAVLESKSAYSGARHELKSAMQMISSSVKDNYSMAETSEGLMELYKEGLVPKTRQNFESALSGYSTGKVELITLIKSLTSLIDYEQMYWIQFVEREKAIARLEAIIAVGVSNRHSPITNNVIPRLDRGIQKVKELDSASSTE